MKQIDTGSVQSLRYHWEAVGNLEYRQDQLQGLSESFQYDALNRLHTVSGPSPMSITYDPHGLGNIQSKTGVGTYTYHPQRPHQVTSTTSGGSYSYDANGNMTSRNGATLTWPSYNLPSSLSSGGDVGPPMSKNFGVVELTFTSGL